MATPKTRRGARSVIARGAEDSYTLPATLRRELQKWARQQPEDFYASLERTIGEALEEFRMYDALVTSAEIHAALKDIATAARKLDETLETTDDFTRAAIRQALRAHARASGKDWPLDVVEDIRSPLALLRFGADHALEIHKARKAGRPRRTKRALLTGRLRRVLAGRPTARANGCLAAILNSLQDHLQ